MSTILRGVLKSFDAASHRATLQLEASLSAYATDVPVSRGIPAAEMVAGRVCLVAFQNPEDTTDAMVLGVH